MGLFDSPLGREKTFSDLKKYVNDFEVTEEKDAGGRLKKKVIYKGPLMVLRDPSPAVFARLWITLGLTLALAAAYVKMLLLTHLAGGQLLVMLPPLAGLFPLLYLLMGAAALPFRGKPMRRDQYMHSFIRVFRSAAAVAACSALGQAAAVIYRAVVSNWEYFPEDWLFTGLGLGVVIAAAGIIFLLRPVEVAEQENPGTGSRKGNEP